MCLLTPYGFQLGFYPRLSADAVRTHKIMESTTVSILPRSLWTELVTKFCIGNIQYFLLNIDWFKLYQLLFIGKIRMDSSWQAKKSGRITEIDYKRSKK